jgi:hypothetical protein
MNDLASRLLQTMQFLKLAKAKLSGMDSEKKLKDLLALIIE